MTVIATKLATEIVQKAAENSKTESKPLQSGQSSFQEMLKNTTGGKEFSDMIGISNEMLPAGQAEAVSAENIPYDAASQGGDKHFDTSGGEKVVNMLSDFNNQQTHMDSLVNDILYSSKKYSNQELLAIQAHVFHVAQLTELTVKSVEMAVSSFKGVMNTQIQ